jgi:RNA polymerase sigma-70 factor (ECF subfamily)
VRRYTRRIAGLVRSIVREAEPVEDVTQVVFIKMFRRLARLRDPEVFEPWLFTLARNTAIDQVRRRRCRPSTVALADCGPQIVDEYQPRHYEEIVAIVDRALLRLGPTDRRLVSMAVAGESYRTMAMETGLSLATVKIRLHRVRPFLRQWVGTMTGLRHPGGRGWGTSSRSRAA